MLSLHDDRAGIFIARPKVVVFCPPGVSPVDGKATNKSRKQTSPFTTSRGG